MAGVKKEVTFEIQDDLDKMLEYAADKYKLADKSKALRVILDYISMDGDWEQIFSHKRCQRCGGKPGWVQGD